MMIDAQVSHRMGNSLCSHPALLISAFGGILLKLCHEKNDDVWGLEVEEWFSKQSSTMSW